MESNKLVITFHKLVLQTNVDKTKELSPWNWKDKSLYLWFCQNLLATKIILLPFKWLTSLTWKKYPVIIPIKRIKDNRKWKFVYGVVILIMIEYLTRSLANWRLESATKKCETIPRHLEADCLRCMGHKVSRQNSELWKV